MTIIKREVTIQYTLHREVLNRYKWNRENQKLIVLQCLQDIFQEIDLMGQNGATVQDDCPFMDPAYHWWIGSAQLIQELVFSDTRFIDQEAIALPGREPPPGVDSHLTS